MMASLKKIYQAALKFQNNRTDQLERLVLDLMAKYRKGPPQSEGEIKMAIEVINTLMALVTQLWDHGQAQDWDKAVGYSVDWPGEFMECVSWFILALFPYASRPGMGFHHANAMYQAWDECGSKKNFPLLRLIRDMKKECILIQDSNGYDLDGFHQPRLPD